MKSLFITATDTGVGKTFVTACLLSLCAENKIDAVPMKPFECGDLNPRDSQALWSATRRQEPQPPWVCPYFFKAPQAPAQAALKEARSIDMQVVLKAFEEAKRTHAHVLVEGCGGLLVPLLPERPEYTVEDLARDMKLPVLIIARAGLGTLNHSLLTLRAARASGLSIAGILLNHSTFPHSVDVSVHDNAATLQRLADVKVWGPLPYVPGANPLQALKLPAFRDILAEILTLT